MRPVAETRQTALLTAIRRNPANARARLVASVSLQPQTDRPIDRSMPSPPKLDDVRKKEAVVPLDFLR